MNKYTVIIVLGIRGLCTNLVEARR